MADLLEFVGPHRAVQLFGVKLVGVNAENGKKLLFSLGLVLLVVAAGRIARLITARRSTDLSREGVRFWSRQGFKLAGAALVVVGLGSIWFDDPGRLTTAMGLVTAGLAFALQKLVAAVAAYFVILRGRTFNVGDRIVMGGVRGDVVALGFTQTTIMEMGRPSAGGDGEDPGWVRSRQYTGRIVTVSNAKIFDEPVFNYTREFPYLWEELTVPLPYRCDRVLAERILLEVAGRHTVGVRELGKEALGALAHRYAVRNTDLGPRVYLRITDNWLELTVRFLAEDHGVRDVKDRLARDILAAFDEAGLTVASATFELTGLPKLRLESEA